MDEYKQSGLSPQERRLSTRFPLQQELSYRVLNGRNGTVAGTGRTLDMSSSGILFTTAERLQLGGSVEVSINWPAQLGGKCPLKLVAIGTVVRSAPACAAVRIERYEFRTRRIETMQTSVAGA